MIQAIDIYFRLRDEVDGTLKLYWGAADIDELVDLRLTDSRPPM